MMENPEVALRNIPRIQVNEEIERLLKELRWEAVGRGDRNENGRQYL
jgi:hypothetical protein